MRLYPIEIAIGTVLSPEIAASQGVAWRDHRNCRNRKTALAHWRRMRRKHPDAALRGIDPQGKTAWYAPALFGRLARRAESTGESRKHLVDPLYTEPSERMMCVVSNSRPFDIGSHPEADVILEGDASLLLWQAGKVALAELASFIGYLDPEKMRDVRRIGSISEMDALLAKNPPLFFLRPREQLELLDGQHRITRSHEIGMREMTIAYATPGIYAPK